ncbi:4-hydroxythreonine-4-phosphate dehydrogenase [sediment metagenome]|uniref:4-hydroxythreonine-4-phosphate dehydrogenase n=1 Tax=sediment metagenome TaxID=749907 RepID=D9PJP4_9ZZZZ
MKKLAVTMGDPGGIGPEIVVKALHSAEIRDICTPVVIGDSSVIKAALRLLKSPLTVRVIKTPKDSKPSKGTIEVVHVIPPTPTLEKGGLITAGKRGKGKKLPQKLLTGTGQQQKAAAPVSVT